MSIAALGGMVKGYGETRHRTTSRLMQILNYLEQTPEIDGATIAALQSAAMTADSHFEIERLAVLNPEPA